MKYWMVVIAFLIISGCGSNKSLQPALESDEPQTSDEAGSTVEVESPESTDTPISALQAEPTIGSNNFVDLEDQFPLDVDAETDQDFILKDFNLWQESYSKHYLPHQPSTEQINSGSAVVAQRLRDIKLWRSSTVDEDEFRIIKNQLKTNVKPNDIDTLPFNLCDSVDETNNDFEILIVFDWMENSQSYQYQTVFRIHREDAIDGIWLTEFGYSTKQTKKRKFIESEKLFRIQTIEDTRLQDLRWHLKCEDNCARVHLLAEMDEEYYAYFYYRTLNSLRYQWDPMRTLAMSVDRDGLRESSLISLGPSQCLDDSSGKVTLTSRWDRIVQDWNSYDYTLDYLYGKYQASGTKIGSMVDGIAKWFD